MAGACVRECEALGIELWELSDDQLRGIHPALTPGVREVLSVPGSLASRNARGGTAPSQVAEQLFRARQVAAWHRDWAQRRPRVQD